MFSTLISRVLNSFEKGLRMELTERRKKILQIVVDEYISDVEPVSSQRVRDRHFKHLSPATIRSELAALEEMGYLDHPHTSAGKVPLPKAYRYYVSTLMEKDKLSRDEIDYIQTYFSKNFSETEALVRNAAKVISDITNYAGVGVKHNESEQRIESIKLVSLSPTTVLLVIVTENSIIKDCILSTDSPLDELYVDTGAEILNRLFSGKTITQAVQIGEESLLCEFKSYRALFSNIIEVLKRYLEMESDRIYTEGASKVLSIPEFADIERAKSFFSIIDNKSKLLKLLKEPDSSGVEMTIKISPDDLDEAKDFSVVTANYIVGGKALGSAGVIGPIRMEYSKVISVLNCIKDTIAEILKKE